MKKLSKSEKKIEKSLLEDEFENVDKNEFESIAKSLSTRKKDAVLSIRINKEDLENIKRKAKKYKIGYQTLISEWLHRIASQ